MTEAKVYVLHENYEWTQHLEKRLIEQKVPYELWDLSEGVLDLSKQPPKGIFYNRMSASSHTRNHRFAPEFSQQVIKWLEDNGRVVLNGTTAIDLEISKVKQYLALQKSGIKTPKTIATIGKKSIVEAAKRLDKYPFITKHNRAGKGAGVYLFNSLAELEVYVNSDTFEEPVDGITLLQEYIKPNDGRVKRSEFIGQKFLYTVSIDSSQGFELCPSDECQIGQKEEKFQIIDPLESKQRESYKYFLHENGLDVAAVEWVEDGNHQIYVYDINTNTNYNNTAEEKAQIFAHKHLAAYLKEQLSQNERE